MPFVNSWDGKLLYAERAEKDRNGKSLELTLSEDETQVVAIGGKSVGGGGPGLPVSETGNTLLFTGTPNGEATWAQLDSTVFAMDDEDSNHVLDESGSPILNEESVSLWTRLNGTGFYAERATADENGDNISETYARKGEVPSGGGAAVSYDPVEGELHLDFSSGDNG